MRTIFLTLILANLLLLAWQFWIDPAPSVPGETGPDELVLYSTEADRTVDESPPRETTDLTSETGFAAAPHSGACFRVGPLPSAVAAQQAGERLTARGVDATPISRDAQVWVGHWVQIGGFATVPAAETARQRLVAGGLADAYLMQDGAQPLISLGVFRDQAGADRVARTARSLGFEVSMRDRYRPTVEQWLMIRPRADQAVEPADLGLADDRILRTERISCEATVTPLSPLSEAVAPAEEPPAGEVPAGEVPAGEVAAGEAFGEHP